MLLYNVHLESITKIVSKISWIRRHLNKLNAKSFPKLLEKLCFQIPLKGCFCY